jgi:hypothetical protein
MLQPLLCTPAFSIAAFAQFFSLATPADARLFRDTIAAEKHEPARLGQSS